MAVIHVQGSNVKAVVYWLLYMYRDQLSKQLYIHHVRRRSKAIKDNFVISIKVCPKLATAVNDVTINVEYHRTIIEDSHIGGHPRTTTFSWCVA